MSRTTVAYTYEPRGAARALWRSKAPEILIEGPAGTGKTRAILQKLVALADKYPGSRHLLVRKTRASMTESVLVTLEQKVIPADHPMQAGPQRAFRQHYDLPNGSRLVIGGMDNPTRTFSTEYDTISYFEAIEGTEDEWENLHRALRNGRMGYHQAIADTNPGAPTHWLNQRAGAGRMERLLSRHEDNPQFYDAALGCWTPEGVEYIGRLDSLTGVRHLRLRKGVWAAAEGAVYESVWDRSIHVIPRTAIPADWPRYWALDFGYTNPFVLKCYAEDPDGRLIRYREIYRTRRLVEDHAKHALELAGWKMDSGRLVRATEGAEPLPVAVICDHDAEGRATFERHTGLATTPAYKAVLEGIQGVTTRLQVAGDGKPRLLYMQDSLVDRDEALAKSRRPCCTEDEFDSYVWPKGQDGRPVKELPVKENDHAMDVDRYMVAWRDALHVDPSEYEQTVVYDLDYSISPV